jgi:hypothetical protein
MEKETKEVILRLLEHVSYYEGKARIPVYNEYLGLVWGDVEDELQEILSSLEELVQ